MEQNISGCVSICTCLQEVLLLRLIKEKDCLGEERHIGVFSHRRVGVSYPVCPLVPIYYDLLCGKPASYHPVSTTVGGCVTVWESWTLNFLVLCFFLSA